MDPNNILKEIQNKIYEVTGNINTVPHVFKFRKEFPYAKSGKRDTLKMMNETDEFIEIDFVVKTEKILKRKWIQINWYLFSFLLSLLWW